MVQGDFAGINQIIDIRFALFCTEICRQKVRWLAAKCYHNLSFLALRLRFKFSAHQVIPTDLHQHFFVAHIDRCRQLYCFLTVAQSRQDRPRDYDAWHSEWYVTLNGLVVSSDRSIAVRVDGFLSNPHSINADVPQGSFISPVLLILFINDLLTSTSSSIHSFAGDTSLSSSFSFNPNDYASTDIQLHKNISASLLSNDLTVMEKWGRDNLVSFNESKTK